MSAPVTYTTGFVADPDEAFESLWRDLSWERRSDAPRREYWTNSLGVDYSYGHGVGRRTYSPRPSHPIIDAISGALFVNVGFIYEACFLNGYEGERDSLGWHADDDPVIDHSRPIAVVTVGGGRAIQFRPKDGDEREEVFLQPGSLLLMLPGMQGSHLHRIPKASFKAKPRISLTFRSLLRS